MNDELRERREKHLRLLRMGVSYTERCERLAEEFGVTASAIENDEAKMDQWIEDVANTASFEKKAAFLLHQHRSQSEGLEQLGWNARQQRSDAEQDVASLRRRLAELEDQGTDGFEDADDYWNTLIRLYRQLESAKSAVFKWVREERQVRGDAAENVETEFDMRQSLGEIEQVADELHVREEREVTERKVLVGVDLNELPGLDQANLVGADVNAQAPVDFCDDG